MGIKEMGLFFIFFSHLCFPSSPSSLHKTLPSVQKNNLGDKGINENNGDSEGGGSGIVRDSRIAHGINGGSVNGGRASGTGEIGNNGGSTSTNTPGGAAVIPVYAAGAANHHHQNSHRNAGSSIGLPTLGAAASLVLHMYIAFGFET